MRWNKIYRDIKGMLEKGLAKKNYNLKGNNTYRVDCVARVVVDINSIETFAKVMKYCERNNVPYIVLGKGSNVLLVSDVLSAVVLVFGTKFSNIYNIGSSVMAESGATLAEVVRYGRNVGLGGMEDAIGIPGTVGGAVVMNASAFGYETRNCVSSILVYVGGKIVHKDREDLGFGYRSSNLQNGGGIVLRVEFELVADNKNSIDKRIREAIAKRVALKQSTYPNAGSVFKNGNNYYAGELIDKSGLKNYNIGDAYISLNHANFIENRGDATGDDIYKLIKYVYNHIKCSHGIEMELEQKIIGDN